MNSKLGKAIWEVAGHMSDAIEDEAPLTQDEQRDIVELLKVLARIADGKPLARAFGAPGDWGYNTKIGNALAGVRG